MKLQADQPIGIFDSGIGGLTIAQSIISRFPNEQVIYFGDTAHLPYGDKSPALVRYYSTKITELLISWKCKLVIIACNTASSAAYSDLVEIFGNRIKIINVVDPIVDELAQMPYRNIGIIGTKTTIASGMYEQRLKAANPEMAPSSLPTPLLAPMIEEGFFNNQISKTVISNYLSNAQLKNIEALILACTHYPLIKKDIEQYYEGKVKVYDSTDFVAKQVGTYIATHKLENTSPKKDNRFYASDLTEAFKKTTTIFFDKPLQLEFYPFWDS